MTKQIKIRKRLYFWTMVAAVVVMVVTLAYSIFSKWWTLLIVPVSTLIDIVLEYSYFRKIKKIEAVDKLMTTQAISLEALRKTLGIGRYDLINWEIHEAAEISNKKWQMALDKLQ